MRLNIIGYTLALLVLCSVMAPNNALEIPEVVKKQVKKLHAICLTKTGATEEILSEAHKGKLPTDDSFKCFLHCMFESFGLIDADNIMHVDALVEVLPPEIHPQIMNLANACGSIRGNDGCDAAFKSVVCYVETDGPFMIEAVDQLFG